MKINRVYLLILSSLFVLFFLISVTLVLKDKVIFDKTSLLLQRVTPTLVQTLPKVFKFPLPRNVEEIPTVSPQNGYGVDTDSQIVKDSEQKILKLNRYLPFQKDLATKSGVPVSILINPPQLQDNTWTLLVQIFGIDYHVNPDMNAYMPMKTAFLESADYVLHWVQEKGVNPEKIIIQWGDKEFVENKAEEWLKTP